MKAQRLFLNWVCIVLAVAPLPGAVKKVRYTLVLADPALMRFEAEAQQKGVVTRTALIDHRSRIVAAQNTVARVLAERKIPVLGAVSGVLNAIFVSADEGSAAELASLPGVVAVAEDLPYKRQMVKAVDLHKVSQAWQSAGGEASAGAGVKIAVLDSGIDHRHAAFQDPSLTMPAGFPRCRAADCSFTNGKVIAARSYVDKLIYSAADNTRPDDESPRDRVGHGTAIAMVAAGVGHVSPLGRISGVAPKAQLGNYKIFGSPGVNDTAFNSAVLPALEDAVNDGMDIAVLSFGRPAVWAPANRGATCDLGANLPCDPLADAVENASSRMLVVVAAGNDGDLGTNSAFAFNSIQTPGSAPSALTVGATTNSQRYRIPVRVSGNAPANLRTIQSVFGNGPRPDAAIRAPLRDAGPIQDGGTACSPLANGSLAGAIAIVQRAGCTFATKIGNAQRAGAVAVLLEQNEGSDFIFPMSGLGESGIPAAMIGSTAGKGLRELLKNNDGSEAVIEPFPLAFPFDQNFVAFFSSLGPSIGEGAIKPEVAAVGYPLYMATQSYDPNGDMYSSNGYVAAQGTSFAAPIAAGTAALFKQRNPSATPAQMKSAVVNTATADVDDVDDSDRVVTASVHAVGAGKVDASGAVRTTLTARETVVSFGYLTTATTFPVGRALNLVNHSNAAANVRLAIEGSNNAAARVVLGDTTLALAGGASRQVAVRLEGARPAPGLYSGVIAITGGIVPLRVPYSFLVGDGTPANIVPLRGYSFNGEAGKAVPIFFKVLDKYGVPVRGTAVTWPTGQIRGGGRIDAAFGNTDALGIHEARIILGPQVGDQEFVAEAGGLTVRFPGRAKLAPVISTDSVVNAASNQVGRGVAPGSYVTIYGRALSDAFKVASTPYLPLSLASVSVGFDAAVGRSYAGRLHFVSDGQINVQVPWELQGLTSAQMKVSIGDVSSALYTVPLNDVSPAAFEIPDPSGVIVAAALDERFGLVTTANALQRGRSGQIYCNGLGPVTNTPATGELSPADPLAASRNLPAVTIGGRPAQVLFSGLTPFTVGLYQINLVPANDTPTGLQPVVITVNGVASKPVNIAIR